MKTITTDLIARFIRGDVKQTAPGLWEVTTATGRKFEIREDGIDFDAVFNGRLQDEFTASGAELRFQSLALAHEIWGTISTDGLNDSTYGVMNLAREYGFPVNDAGQRPFSTTEARRYFGGLATVQRSHFPFGWRIDLPDQSRAVIGTNAREELALLGVRGGRDIYAAALRLLAAKQGYAVVAGSREHVTNGILNAAALDIELLPEVMAWWPRLMMLGGLITASALRIEKLSYAVGTLHNSLFLWTALGVGISGAVAMLALPHSKPEFRRARRRGLELMDKLPLKPPITCRASSDIASWKERA